MAQVTIGQLNEITNFDDNDVFPIYNQTLGTRKIASKTIKQNVFSNIDTVDNELSIDTIISNGDFIILTKDSPQDTIKTPKTISFSTLKEYLLANTDIDQNSSITFLDVYGPGVSIPAGSDLNDYITIGKYYSGIAGNNISNYPITSGTIPQFNLVVEKIFDNIIRQSIRPINKTDIYTREIIQTEKFVPSQDTQYNKDKIYYEENIYFTNAFLNNVTYDPNKTYYIPQSNFLITGTDLATPSSSTFSIQHNGTEQISDSNFSKCIGSITFNLDGTYITHKLDTVNLEEQREFYFILDQDNKIINVNSAYIINQQLESGDYCKIILNLIQNNEVDPAITPTMSVEQGSNINLSITKIKMLIYEEEPQWKTIADSPYSAVSNVTSEIFANNKPFYFVTSSVAGDRIEEEEDTSELNPSALHYYEIVEQYIPKDWFVY